MPEQPTPPDLAELSRCLFASASRRDLDALLRLHAPDAAWDLSDAGFGVFEGVQAIRSFLEDWFGAFECYRVDVEEAVDLGGGVTFVAVNATGRPVGMDASVQQPRGWVARWNNGKLVRAVSYLDLEQAQEVAQRLAKSSV
jgi:ketosteroid isomerase-like protein